MNSYVFQPLPPDVVRGASLRGNEYGWKIADFPTAAANAKLHHYGCLGGQFQFRTPDGTYEMYWLSADPSERRDGETWHDYCERSCSEVLSKFEKLMATTDFVTEAANWQLHPSAVQSLVFVADFVTESELAKLSTKQDT